MRLTGPFYFFAFSALESLIRFLFHCLIMRFLSSSLIVSGLAWYITCSWSSVGSGLCLRSAREERTW